MGLRGNKRRATIVLRSFFKSKGYYVLLGPLRESKSVLEITRNKQGQ